MVDPTREGADMAPFFAKKAPGYVVDLLALAAINDIITD